MKLFLSKLFMYLKNVKTNLFIFCFRNCFFFLCVFAFILCSTNYDNIDFFRRILLYVLIYAFVNFLIYSKMESYVVSYLCIAKTGDGVELYLLGKSQYYRNI